VAGENSLVNQIQNHFAILFSTYGFWVTSYTEKIVRIQSDTVMIRFTEDRGQVFVDISPNATKERWIDLFDIVYRKSRLARWIIKRYHQPKAEIPYKARIEKSLDQQKHLMVNYCQDILTGDFSIFKKFESKWSSWTPSDVNNLQR
jgi:hypothetical protein